jgi:hypothetical protein
MHGHPRLLAPQTVIFWQCCQERPANFGKKYKTHNWRCLEGAGMRRKPPGFFKHLHAAQPGRLPRSQQWTLASYKSAGTKHPSLNCQPCRYYFCFCFSIFLRSSRSAEDNLCFSTKCINNGFTEPPKTRERKDSLSSCTDSASDTKA